MPSWWLDLLRKEKKKNSFRSSCLLLSLALPTELMSGTEEASIKSCFCFPSYCVLFRESNIKAILKMIDATHICGYISRRFL